jgi:hypothetical protein
MNDLPIDTVMTWVKPQYRGSFYELRSGSAVLATLHFDHRGGTAESRHGRWGLDRDMTTVLRVWDEVTKRFVARATRPSWSGRRTVTVFDRQFDWQTATVWRTRWQFSLAGQPVATFGRGRGVLRRPVTVSAARSAISPAELELLSIVGAYFLLSAEADDAVAGSIAAIVSTLV